MTLCQILDGITVSHGHPEHPARDWLNAMSERLQQQWPTIDPQRLDDFALDLWRDERLRPMPPAQAAAVWLEPVTAAR